MRSKDFKEQVYGLRNRLYRLAKWMMQNSEDAEDVVQEVFLKLWSKKETLGQYDNLEAFTIRVTKNLCLNKLKSKKTSLLSVDSIEVKDIHSTPLEVMSFKHNREIMDRIIGSLPEQQRAILQLRNVEGLSIRDISGILDLSENNVRVILSRARKQIKEKYVKYHDHV
ncbi:RNA polymerase sigma factor [Fulvivirgaceae bacterium BMA10]|uniref:RNA polymerase sigma factor n=1 Tax=Splendidivirga corallicola TaxID=3051826 RepID=A0ABT8KJB6_9BACT|nr:RNA polymerase sigma factor [Fulvivirgaceae bacterium BMA10]